MNFNHGLLSALGVSSGSLSAMVWAARDAGALGAKLTGAGGGGCVVALDETEETATALEYTPGCQEAFRAALDTDGVRAEEQ
jgi:mevalonate kinase